jgi:hypothetical protein
MTRKLRNTAGKEGSVRVLGTPLVFPDDVLARVPAGVQPDHLLLESVKAVDIVITLPFPLEATYDDTIQLILEDQPFGNEILVDTYIPDQDIPFTVPADQRLTEGPHAINYKLIYRSGSGQEEFGPANQQFIVDYTAPGGSDVAPPTFAGDVVADAVTPDRLSDDGTGNEYLPAKIPAYFGQAVGDRLSGHIDGGVATAVVEVAGTDVGKDVELRFTRTALEAADGDIRDFTFDVEDRAGNRNVSGAIGLRIRMKQLISDPLPPRVPAASDGLIDYADAHAPGGVAVQIPPHAAILPGDSIVIVWVTYESEPHGIVAGDIGNDPLIERRVPYAEVYRDWSATSADADRRIPADVTYRIYRGGALAGQPAVATTVDVNLYTPGGVDPDPETPGHEALDPPTVVSASGRENYIPVGDQQSDGLVVVPWESALPGREVFARDDIVTITFGRTVLQPPYSVTAADVSAAVPLRIILPASAIGTETVDVVSVTYAVRRSLAAGGSNEVSSPLRQVTIEDEAGLPGGGTLSEGVFPELNAHLTLGPHEILGGTPFVCTYDGKEGDTIRFEFVFVGGNRHLADEVPISERFHSSSVTLLSDASSVTYDIPEEALQYKDNPPLQMHIHANYYVTRPPFSEVKSEETFIYLDCRGED